MSLTKVSYSMIQGAPVNILDFGAKGDGVTDDTDAFDAAINSGANEVYIPAGEYVATITAAANVALIGAGANVCTIKIPAGNSTDSIVSGSNVNYFSIKGLRLDYTGGTGADVHAAYFNNCDNLIIDDLYVYASTGIALWLLNCETFRVTNCTADSVSNDWGMLFDGNGSSQGYAANLYCVDCSNRGVMVRGAKDCQFFGIAGNGNNSAALWMLDCSYCIAVGVTDLDDVGGDSVVIEGASVGCQISEVTARDCGGFTASISSSSTAAPVNCKIVNVYSENAGECMAAISDQSTGLQPAFCYILNVQGKNCGQVTQSEGFAISNGVNCEISGLIFDTNGGMTYAVKEGGTNPSNNIFTITSWISGTQGYFSISSSTSTISFQRLQARTTHVGDSDLAWNPATYGDYVLYDTASLTTNRAVTLGLAWPGRTVNVARSSGGGYDLAIRQGLTGITTLAANESASLVFDGTNWNLLNIGTV